MTGSGTKHDPWKADMVIETDRFGRVKNPQPTRIDVDRIARNASHIDDLSDPEHERLKQTSLYRNVQLGANAQSMLRIYDTYFAADRMPTNVPPANLTADERQWYAWMDQCGSSVHQEVRALRQAKTTYTNDGWILLLPLGVLFFLVLFFEIASGTVVP